MKKRTVFCFLACIVSDWFIPFTLLLGVYSLIDMRDSIKKLIEINRPATGKE